MCVLPTSHVSDQVIRWSIDVTLWMSLFFFSCKPRTFTWTNFTMLFINTEASITVSFDNPDIPAGLIAPWFSSPDCLKWSSYSERKSRCYNRVQKYLRRFSGTSRSLEFFMGQSTCRYAPPAPLKQLLTIGRIRVWWVKDTMFFQDWIGGRGILV